MKLLHIGLNAGFAPPNGLQKAFMRYYEYEEIAFNTPNINDVIRQKSDSFKPDIVWMQIQTPDIINPKTIEYLKEHGIFIMNWMGDIRNEFPEWTAELGASLTCFSNMNYVDELNSRGIKSDFLQTGYDDEIYTPIGEKEKAPEIVFFGNHYGTFPLSKLRSDMVSFLKEHYGDNFGLYGRGWDNSDGDYMNDPMSEAAIYRGAKIAINLSHFDYKRCSSSRLYKILGCGTFCLTKHYPEIEKDFFDYLDLIIWYDLHDLKSKIDYFLWNEKTRNEISKKGSSVASTYYIYKKMVENIHQLYLKYK